MPSIKEYNNKISSFKNTSKITKTMKMVSASKLRRANTAQATARVYSERLQKLLLSMFDGTKIAHPLTQSKDQVKNKLVVIFTSDRGLCGGFNNNLIKSLAKWTKSEQDNAISVSVSACGKRGFNAFKKLSEIDTNYEDVTAKPDPVEAANIAKDIEEAFLSGKYDEIYFAYNYFQSAMSQEPRIEKVLPLSLDDLEQEESSHTDYICEPKKEELLEALIPQYLQFQVFYTLLENAAGEHGARMTAMDNATRNTADLIDRYTLLRNRARQAAITTELIEIISGAEALNG